MIKTKPILFSFSSILAMRDNKKTQTRRVIKHQPVIDQDSGFVFSGDHSHAFKNDISHRPWQAGFIEQLCPYQVGEVLRVKETYYQHGVWVKNKNDKWLFSPANGKVYYSDQVDIAVLENDPTIRSEKFGLYKRDAMFMPNKYTRYWIEVTGIKMERVQDISEEDAKAEGVFFHSVYPSPRMEYAKLWEKINGKGSWDANPWVWAYTFKLTENPNK